MQELMKLMTSEGPTASMSDEADEALRNSSLSFDAVTISLWTGSELFRRPVIHSVLNRGLSPNARISIC